jgi:hypothetical protein
MIIYGNNTPEFYSVSLYKKPNRTGFGFVFNVNPFIVLIETVRVGIHKGPQREMPLVEKMDSAWRLKRVLSVTIVIMIRSDKLGKDHNNIKHKEYNQTRPHKRMSEKLGSGSVVF